jgi:hypothetical protein
VIASRTLTVLAAAAFVAAVALATLFSPLATLAEVVLRDDARALFGLRDMVVGHASQWVWDNLALPLLQRPAWLLPVAFGAVCAGGATTLASRASVPRSHRRRS